MIRRILTAAVLLPVVLALVLWAPAWLFLLGVLLFGLPAIWEYLELAGRAGSAPARLPLYLATVGVLGVAGYFPRQLLPVIVGSSLLLFLFSLIGRQMTAEVLPASAASAFGLLYIAVPFALLLDLRGAEQGRWVVLYLLLLVWVGDAAAYFVGGALGRHKLAPRLSPGKTIEGTAASLVATLLVGYWLFRSWPSAFGFGPMHAWLLPLLVNLAAQLGDLGESALKRSAGVKDSSALFPGHGGVLDRVDSLLFAVPVVWYYWKVLTQGGL